MLLLVWTGWVWAFYLGLERWFRGVIVAGCTWFWGFLCLLVSRVVGFGFVVGRVSSYFCVYVFAVNCVVGLMK